MKIKDPGIEKKSDSEKKLDSEKKSGIKITPTKEFNIFRLIKTKTSDHLPVYSYLTIPKMNVPTKYRSKYLKAKQMYLEMKKET